MKNFLFFVFIIFSFTLKPFAGLTQEIEDNQTPKPWFNLNKSIFDEEKGLGDLFQQIDKVICNYDNLGDTICFEFGWHNPCFQLYAFFAPASARNVTFSETQIPVFRIDENSDYMLNEFVEYKEEHGVDYLPRVTFPKFALWLLQYGNYKDFLSQEDGFVIQVLKGQTLQITGFLQDESRFETTVELIGIEPFLKNSLAIMKAIEPEETICRD